MYLNQFQATGEVMNYKAGTSMITFTLFQEDAYKNKCYHKITVFKPKTDAYKNAGILWSQALAINDGEQIFMIAKINYRKTDKGLYTNIIPSVILSLQKEGMEYNNVTEDDIPF